MPQEAVKHSTEFLLKNVSSSCVSWANIIHAGSLANVKPNRRYPLRYSCAPVLHRPAIFAPRPPPSPSSPSRNDMSKRAKTNHACDGDYTLYAARAGAAVTHMTSRPGNAKILRLLRNNDPGFTVLHLGGGPKNSRYMLETRSMGWLGYFIGESKHLKSLHLNYLVNRDEILAFSRGLNRNRSVEHLTILNLGPTGALFQALAQFFAENKNLVKVVVSLNGGIPHQLSQALRSCTSLKIFTINLAPEGVEYDDEAVAEIIRSLSEKSQLEEAGFPGCLGRRGYRALADLLAWKRSQLQNLDIGVCDMDVEDFECLLNAVASNQKLHKLDMDDCWGRGEGEHDNNQATLALTRAWGSIERPLLEAFTSNLIELDIRREGGSLDDEGAVAFAHALAGNRKLKVLRADWEQLTSRGWDAISRLLCDTSSPEATHSSNHTLQDLGLHEEESEPSAVYVMFRNQIDPLLALNRYDDKYRVASVKILKTHDDFDMQIFFNWEFKMLPIVVQWLARAATSVLTDLPANPNIQRRKLSVIYQFVRSAPKSFVESCLRGESEEIRAREERIRGEQEMMPQERMPQELEWLEERRRVIMNKLRG